MKEKEDKQEDQTQNVDDQKTASESQKRQAQAEQIQVETEMMFQDASLGPVGRAQVKQLEKPPQLNGFKHEWFKIHL